MSKYDLTERKVTRWIKEGRGLHILDLYEPWHQVNEIPSRGITSLYYGITTHRHHHLFSLLELYILLMLDWALNITDIREQFPLLPRRQTIDIARKLGVKHPIARRTKTLWVMTTDFLITVKTPSGLEYWAIAVKPSKELSKKRVQEKLEIERLYWDARGVKWLVMTEQDIPKELIRNIRLVTRHFFLEDRQISQSLLCTALQIMEPQIRNQELSLRDITTACDHILNIKPGLSLSMIFHMIATRQWAIDMSTLIDTRQPLAVNSWGQ